MIVSVIIPTYNREKLLPRAINSLLKQSIKPDEIIIVDDGSSDNTKNIFKDYPIRYIYQENSGVSIARNRGIKEAKNEWIAFLDSDDEWRKDKLQKQIEFLNDHPNIKFCHTGEKWIRDTKEIKYPKRLKKPKGWCFLDNLETCKIAVSSVLAHKSIFEKVGYFDEYLRVCEDYDLWLRVSYEFEIGLIDEPLIIKYAGHRQLSDEIFAIDRYHINSLLKFLDGRYKNEVKEVILRKLNILKNGAIKRNNKDMLIWCKNVENRIDI